MTLSRRSFLKNSAAAMAFSASPNLARSVMGAQPVDFTPGPGNKWPGRVVINFNKAAASASTANEAVVKRMVDQSIMLLTGKSDVGEAWKEIFPATLTLKSKVAIKIGLLNTDLPARDPFTVMGITEGLQKMDFGGTKFPAANITLYDGNNPNGMDGRGYTKERFPNIVRTHYGPNVRDTQDVNSYVNQYFQKFGDGARNMPYAPVLSPGGADFLINVFIPRGHA